MARSDITKSTCFDFKMLRFYKSGGLFVLDIGIHRIVWTSLKCVENLKNIFCITVLFDNPFVSLVLRNLILFSETLYYGMPHFSYPYFFFNCLRLLKNFEIFIAKIVFTAVCVFCIFHLKLSMSHFELCLSLSSLPWQAGRRHNKNQNRSQAD